jgi:hypothetical protein
MFTPVSRPRLALVLLVTGCPPSGARPGAEVGGPLAALAEVPRDFSRYRCQDLPHGLAPLKAPGMRNCILRDTLPDGSGLTITVDSTGRIADMLQAWPMTPDPAAHAARLAAVLPALERRLGPPTVCGRAEPAWHRLYLWATDDWIAELGTSRDVRTQGPASIQFQARFKIPEEEVICGDGSAAGYRRAEADRDTAFADVQARGGVAMGVDQYTSTHVFEPLPDGGRIELQRDGMDAAGAAQIRDHMRTIAAAFAAGDFRVPGFVHKREVPGTALMAARRSAITYAVESLPQGAALRLRTSDRLVVEAIHEFLAFQRQDHHAGARGSKR